LIAIASSGLTQLKRYARARSSARTRRLIFIAGLIGLVVLALVMQFVLLR
jgi:hypothetical protein